MWCRSLVGPPEAGAVMLVGFLLGFCPLKPILAQDDETVEIRRMVIGLDLSKSNPLTDNAAYARKQADWLADQVKALRLGAVIHIRTFGVSDATQNTLRIDTQVTLRNPPEKIAQDLAALIENIPALIAEGKLEAQDQTNIVGFIRTNIRVIGECNTPTEFILLTDGLEDSEYGHLTGAGGTLSSPEIKPPQDKRYKCEELVLLGLGQGLANHREAERLRSVWADWVKKSAPFKQFRGLEDW